MRCKPKPGPEPSVDFDPAWPVDARDSWPEDRRECRRCENCKWPVWGHPRKTAGLSRHRRYLERSHIARGPYPETRRSGPRGISHAGWPPGLPLSLKPDRHAGPPKCSAGGRYTKQRAVPVYVSLNLCQRFQSSRAANGAAPTDTEAQDFFRIQPDPGLH